MGTTHATNGLVRPCRWGRLAVLAGLVFAGERTGSATNLHFVGIAVAPGATNVVGVTAAYPLPFSNRLSLIACTNLLAPTWTLLATTNPPATTNNTVTYGDADPSGRNGRLYHVFNADHDGDGDGLSDGAESFLVGSRPDNPDTDSDRMGDGAEVAHGFDPKAAASYLNLPYTQDFEALSTGALSGQDGWFCAPTGRVVVQTNAAYAGGKAAAFLVSTQAPNARQFLAARGVTNVWIDFCARVDPRSITRFDDHPDLAAAPAYAPSLFAFNRRGEVWAYDGGANAWTTDLRFTVADVRWHRFTVRQDYGAKTWDLFADRKLVFQGLGFRRWLEPFGGQPVDITEFSGFTLVAGRGGGAYVDDLAIGTNRPAGLYGALRTADARVAANADDAQEDVGSDAVSNDGDLYLGYNGNDTRVVGVRFAGLGISNGAAVHAACLQFTEKDTGPGPDICTMTIEAQDADDALPFAERDHNITSRPRTSQAVAWPIPGWRQSGEAGHRQRTPDLAGLVRAVVTRGGWQADNGLVFILSTVDTVGNDPRVAVDYNSTDNKGPLLHVEWADPLP